MPFTSEKKIVILVILLLLFGQIMLFSATGVMGLQRQGSEFHYLIRQGFCALIGALLMLGFSRVRYQFLHKMTYFIMLTQILLIGATLFGHFSHRVAGASRWLIWGPVAFQPSELAKISLTLYLAHILSVKEKTPLYLRHWLLHCTVVSALILLVLKQPDFGSAVLLCAVVIGLLFLAGIRPLYIGGMLGCGFVGIAFAMLNSDYRKRRLFAFLNPWADPQGSGFQTIQSFLSFHSGKIFGVGLGNGNSKLFYLPEVHTDFIFSLVGEELGFLGAIVLLGAFLYLSYLLFKVSLRAPDTFGCYLSFGLALSLTLQVAVNLGGVTGIVPVKGLPLPFVSWGRSALIVNLIMVGIILNIARQSGKGVTQLPGPKGIGHV